MSVTNKRKFVSDQSYPVLSEWVINKEKLRGNEIKSIIGSYLNVENLPTVKYHLKIELKRVFNSVEGTWIFLYLLMPSDMVINVDAKISCKTADFNSEWTHKYENSLNGYGSQLCLSSELFNADKKFIVDNQLTITLKASFNVESKDAVVPKTLKGESLGWQLWDNEEDKDATIVVNGKEIKVHKCVLKRRSSKFQCLFKVKSEPSSKKKNGDKIVVKNHTYDTVKEAIMFCYDIQSSDTLSAEDATDMLKFSHEYQILDLKKNMEEFSIENLSISNVCTFANASMIVEDVDKLYRKCFDFLLKCMKDGTAVKDIEDLDEDMQKELFLQSFTKICNN